MSTYKEFSKDITPLLYHANKVGGNAEDYQLLLKARELNNFMSLDCEPIVFGLLKMGIKPQMREFLMLSETTIRDKIEAAIEKNIIPDYLNIELQVFMLVNKILASVESQMGTFINGVEDQRIIDFTSEQRREIARAVILFSQENKPVDIEFLRHLDNTGMFSETELEVLKLLFEYRGLCYGNNQFVNLFVTDNVLEPIDSLLIKRKVQLETLLVNNKAILADETLPDDIRISADEQETEVIKMSAKKYAQHIVDEGQKQFPTRALLLKLSTVIEDELSLPNWNIVRECLVYQGGATNNSHLLEVKPEGVDQPQLYKNKTFDFNQHIIRDYIKALENENHEFYTLLNDGTLGVSPDSFIEAITVIQRLFYLVNDNVAETITLLISKGYKSAFDIVKIGKEELGEKLNYSRSETDRLFNAAKKKVNKILFLLHKNSQYSNALQPKPIPSINDLGEIAVVQMPELETLIGSLDLTDTPHAESVFGAAAYLVDLLDFTKEISNSNEGNKLYDTLIARRPDISKIKLNRENTLKTVPYIDLVNEVLEYFISPDENTTWNTTDDEDIVKIRPQNCNYEVYQQIKNHITWKNDPFNIWNEEFRMYTNAFGFNRAKWFKLQNMHLEASMETLSFNKEDEKLFLGNSVAELDGSLAETIDLVEDENFFDYRLSLRRLLQYTGMQLEELSLILDSYYINPIIVNDEEYRHAIHFKDQVDLDHAFLQFIGSDHLSHFIYSIYQYRRLQKATGWSISLLDNLLIEIGEGTDSSFSFNNAYLEITNPLLDSEALRKIGQIKFLQNEFNLPEISLAKLFGCLYILDYRTEKSVIEDFFSNRLTSNNFRKIIQEILHGTTNEFFGKSIVNEPVFMSNLFQFLDISETQKELFIELLSLSTITESSIRQLIRVKALKEASGLNDSEFKAFWKLLNWNTDWSIDSVYRALENVSLFKEKGQSFQRIFYLDSGEIVDSESLQIASDNDICTTAYKISSLISDHSVSGKDTDSEEFIRKFYELINKIQPIAQPQAELIFQKHATIYDKDSEYTDVDFYFRMLDLAIKRALSENQMSIILDYLSHNVYEPQSSTIQDQNVLKTIINNGEIDESIILDKYFNENDGFISYLETLQFAEETEKQIKSYLGLIVNIRDRAAINSYELIRELLDLHYLNLESLKKHGSWYSNENADAKKLMKLICQSLYPNKAEEKPVDIETTISEVVQQYILESDSSVSGINPASIAEVANNAHLQMINVLENKTAITEIKTLISKALKICRFTSFTNLSTEWLSDLFINTDLFDLTNYHGAGLSAYIKMLHLANLSEHLTNPNQPFTAFNILNDDTLTNDKWSSLFSWPVDLEVDYNIPTSAEERLLWFIELSNIAVRSIDPALVKKWLIWDVDAESVSRINDLKTQLSELSSLLENRLLKSEYFEKARELRDNIRVKQRDALVSYILTIQNQEGGQLSEDDLFSYFLIDTQMSPSVETSRIVQATLSIQLLFKRIQFKLEPGIQITKDAENRWNWMNHYRVWEANRKIFLYPENWLEPELRDDKTPFFREFEEELKNQELDSEKAGVAFRNYLQRLEKVNTIEICQLYSEGKGQGNRVHVIGRTRRVPHEYYYRYYDVDLNWSPWYTMGIDIQTNHIIPVVIENRLFAIWPEFSEIKEEPKDIKENTSDKENGSSGFVPVKKLKTFICWSEYKNGVWSDKQVTNHNLTLDFVGEHEIAFSVVASTLTISRKNPNAGKSSDTWPKVFDVTLSSGIEITPTNQEGNNVETPDGFEKFYQKYKTNNVKNVTFPIPGRDGIIESKRIVSFDNSNDNLHVYIIYPHHFEEINGDAPYFIEYGNKTFFIQPELNIEPFNPDRSSIKQAIDNMTQFDEEFSFYNYVNDEPSNKDYYTDEDSDLHVVDTMEVKTIIRENKIPKENRTAIQQYYTHKSAHIVYHPFIEQINDNLANYGISGVLDPEGEGILKPENLNNLTESQNKSLLPYQLNNKLLDEIIFNSRIFLGQKSASTMKLREVIDFNRLSGLNMYNWEMFFHVPFMIANQFYSENKFDESLEWMHYIFDPRLAVRSENTDFKDFWKFRPFALHGEQTSIEEVLFTVNKEEGIDEEFERHIHVWSNDPFKPHKVARLRISAYMKATIMRYLDILIARGDEQFRADTRESINVAMMDYITAGQILGNQPDVLTTNIETPISYEDFDSVEMGNAIETLEEAVIKPHNAAIIERLVETAELKTGTSLNRDSKMIDMVNNLFARMQQTEKAYKLYFGVPKNDKLFNYWRIVGDRLFKIRHSLNIDGVKRSLALFAPPIDPGLLASAIASGVNISDVISMQNGNDTDYNYKALHGKAIQLAGDLKSVCDKLLSVSEKKDSEQIALLHAEHKVILNEAVSQLKKKAIDEAELAIEQLELQEKQILFRKEFYKERDHISEKEQLQIGSMKKANEYSLGAQTNQLFASFVSIFPDIDSGLAGTMGSPFFTTKFGGAIMGRLPQLTSQTLNMLAAIENHRASKAGILAGFNRRKEDWDFQVEMANHELDSIAKQKLSAEIRKQMAQLEWENHQTQINQSIEDTDVLKDKFTNEALYHWMQKEMSTIQRQAYNLAFDIAKKSEAAFNYELMPDAYQKFIQNGHTRDNFKGILAGEKLYQELREMDVAYIENNKRKYELTKHVSLAMLDPQQVLDLRENGSCELFIPEILFDVDHPGHANRRIKSVSLTIPCVAGPYTSVSAELSLIRSTLKNKQQEVMESKAAISKMATSSAQNDSGLFQLNFNDERYLPFEGAGVDSHWVLSLPNSVRQFDYNTINDVVLTINYTAENAGNRQTVEAELKDGIIKALTDSQDSDAASENGNKKQRFAILIDIKNQYPEVFNSLKTVNTDLKLTNSVLPYFLKVVSSDGSHAVKVVKYTLYDGAEMVGNSENIALELDETEKSIEITKTDEVENLVMIAEIEVA